VEGTVALRDFTGANVSVAFDGKLFFDGADESGSSDELWVSDGTVAGTHLFTDLAPGNIAAAYTPVVAGGTLFFLAGRTDGGQGMTLWQSDGTPVGTGQVLDAPPTGFGPTGLTAAGTQVFFSASDPVAGREIWRSDGTAAGTYWVADIRPGTGSGYSSSIVPPIGSAAKGGAYFFADDGVIGNELWFSDGSTAPGGTRLVKDLYPGAPAGALEIVPALLDDGRLVFTGRNGAIGDEPFVSDATADGTHPLADIDTRTNDSNPTEILDFNGEPLVVASPPVALQDPGDPLSYQMALFRPDLAGGGATMLSRAFPKTSESIPFTGRGRYAYATFKGQTYYFSTTALAPKGLYRTDGTAAGTGLFGTFSAVGGEFAVAGDRLYFAAFPNSASSGTMSLSRPDGTVAGTQLVGSASGGSVAHLAVAGDAVYFALDNSNIYRVTNGDAAAKKIATISGQIRDLKVVNGKIFFTANTASGLVVRTTDDMGADAGVNLARTATDLVPVNGRVFFRGGSDNVLYVSDSTVAGTRALIAPGGKTLVGFNLRAVGDYLYFVANDGVHGSEWWRTDGTNAGTALWQDMVPGSGGSDPTSGNSLGNDYNRAIVSWRGSLYFTAFTPGTGMELWRVDEVAGGSATPVLVEDVYPGGTSSDPAGLTTIGDELYFAATAPDVGREVFKVVDDVAPRVLHAGFDPSGPNGGVVRVYLSEGVTVGSQDAPTLLNLNDRSVGSVGAVYEPGTRTLAITPTSRPSDGDYRLTIPKGSLTDAGGNALASDFSFDFFVLAGDANRDRVVDFNDLVKLAQNYNTTGGKTYADGDFTGDGDVDFDDLVVLAQHYNTSLPGATAPSAIANFSSDLAVAFVLAAPKPTPVPATPRRIPSPKSKPAPTVHLPVTKAVAPVRAPAAFRTTSPARVTPPVFGDKRIKPRRDVRRLFV
jgi:ELWxxDGT repeat protein